METKKYRKCGPADWQSFRAFTAKEFRHIFRDGRTLLILLAMPLVLTVLFGYAITTEVKGTRIALLDPSKDAVTRRVAEELGANRYFSLVERLEEDRGVADVFREGRADLVVAFSPDFAANMLHGGDAAVQLLADGTEPNQATIRVGYAQNVLAACLADLRGEHSAAGGIRAASAGAGTAVPVVAPQVRFLYNPQQRSEFNFVPGVMGMIFLLVCAMMSSIAIVREKEAGTMEVLLASPLSPACIVLSKAVPYFAISCFDLATVLAFSTLVLGIPVAGSWAALIGVSLLYILVALALGLLISTLVASQLAAMLLSGMVLMIPTVVLSGTVFPIESMPQWLQWVSAIVPARWYTEAVRKLMVQGVELRYVAREMAVLGFMLVAFAGVAVAKFKVRLY